MSRCTIGRSASFRARAILCWTIPRLWDKVLTPEDSAKSARVTTEECSTEGQIIDKNKN